MAMMAFRAKTTGFSLIWLKPPKSSILNDMAGLSFAGAWPIKVVCEPDFAAFVALAQIWPYADERHYLGKGSLPIHRLYIMRG